jgi:hypothetical protein
MTAVATFHLKRLDVRSVAVATGAVCGMLGLIGGFGVGVAVLIVTGFGNGVPIEHIITAASILIGAPIAYCVVGVAIGAISGLAYYFAARSPAESKWNSHQDER